MAGSKRGGRGVRDRTVVARIHGAKPEPDTHATLDGKAQGEAEGDGRIIVVLESRRTRLQDADNDAASHKNLLDGLRYAGFIPEDNPKAIRLVICDQVRVKTKAEEGTRVRVIYPKGMVDEKA